jgi:hypothetical protein
MSPNVRLLAASRSPAICCTDTQPALTWIKRSTLLVAGMLAATSHFEATHAWDVTTHGNNGWGNGGDDGTNAGSDKGQGVSQGGPGAGTSQSDSKSADTSR